MPVIFLFNYVSLWPGWIGMIPIPKKNVLQSPEVLNNCFGSKKSVQKIMIMCTDDVEQTLQLHKMKSQFQQRGLLDQLVDQHL